MRAIAYPFLLLLVASCNAPTAAPAPTGSVATAQERLAPGTSSTACACEACKPGAEPAAANREGPKIDLARSDRIVLGSPSAAHRIVVFTDPDCPYCAKLQGTLDKLVHDRRDVRVEVRLFPLPMHGETAETASK